MIKVWKSKDHCWFLNDKLDFDTFNEMIKEFCLSNEDATTDFVQNLWEELGIKYRSRYIYQPDYFLNDFIAILKRNKKQVQVLYKVWIYEITDLEKTLITKNINSSKDSLNTSGFQNTSYFNDLEEEEEGPSTERNYNIAKSYRYSDGVLINRAKSSKLQSGIVEFVHMFKELFSISVYKNYHDIFDDLKVDIDNWNDKNIRLENKDTIKDLIDNILSLPFFENTGMDGKYVLSNWVAENLILYNDKDLPIFRTYGTPLKEFGVKYILLGMSKYNLVWRENNG